MVKALKVVEDVNDGMLTFYPMSLLVFVEIINNLPQARLCIFVHEFLFRYDLYAVRFTAQRSRHPSQFRGQGGAPLALARSALMGHLE